MPDAWTRLLFELKKKYSAPILLLLYSKKELTFDQIYDLCCSKGRTVKISARRGLLGRERGPRYRAISRGSVSRAIAELKNKKYVTKEARLGEKGRSYSVYILTPEIKQLMERHLKK